jgi:2-succinyl-5-enolpyruvyl-6-hydroxy-3-cyclohexene-1-carboxylate synthase
LINWNILIIANPDGGNVFSSLEFARQKETGATELNFVIIDNLDVYRPRKNTLP